MRPSQAPHRSASASVNPQYGSPKPVEYSPKTQPLDAINTSPPTVDKTVAMTIAQASAAPEAATLLARDSPMSQSRSLKLQAATLQDQAAGRSSPADPPCSPMTMSSTASEKTYFEHTPSPYHRPSLPNALAEAIHSSKSPGLIRRFSKGAQHKLRRRASQQQSLRIRDESVGPIIVRGRRDSSEAPDVSQDVSDLELDEGDNVADDISYPSRSRERANGLGISLQRPSNASSNFEGGIAPAVSAILQAGTWASKHANKNKKAKRIRLWLDPTSARVRWHSSNHAKSFFIDDVREVRVGAESRNARDDVQVQEQDEDRWVTIVYEPPERSKGRTIKTMHLVFDSPMLVKYWSDALSSVARERIEIMNALASSPEKSDKSMAMVWRLAMSRKGSDAAQVFTVDDARWFCRKLEINCSDSAVRTHFLASDPKNSGSLDYNGYRDFVGSFKERKDIQHLYRNINFGTDLDMSQESFFTFLKNDQGVDVDRDRSYWEGVFDKAAKLTQPRANAMTTAVTPLQPLMNMQAFQNFLLSNHNLPLITNKEEALLERPLNEYFISSSHNTYLLGRQVYGDSSVEGYIAALIKGCRCVEIDCWDGEDGRPMVTHGHTMTTKVLFEDCVSSVARYAFHSSPYPLIVSLEVHCSAQQQKAMVDLMFKYWRALMVTKPIDPNATALPSPEELKGKILVKVKVAEEDDSRQPNAIEGPVGRNRARSLGSAVGRLPSVDSRAFTSMPRAASPAVTSPSDTTLDSMSTPQDSIPTGTTASPNSSAEDSEDNQMSLEKARKGKTSKIIHELGKLGVYAQGIKFEGFDEPQAKTLNHIFSFNENTFAKISAKSTEMKTDIDTHNFHYLMRVYPRPGRLDSSNFNPLEVWRRGVQMAALNWQTYDLNQQLHEAMFAAGPDRVGYVLKPEILRDCKQPLPSALEADTSMKRNKQERKFVKFNVDIISAQRLPRPRNQNPEHGMNPYVEFEMYQTDDKTRGIARGDGGTDASAPNGYSGIGSPLRKRTKIVEGNGFDPIFNTPLTLTVVTKHPSLIFVRWTVWNSPEARFASPNNALLATFTAKLSSLQQGYRHLPLFNPQGEQYRDAKLFVRIRKEAPFSVDENAVCLAEPGASPRVDAARPERPWRRVFSRNSSQRRVQQQSDDIAGLLSRTSSMDRESVR